MFVQDKAQGVVKITTENSLLVISSFDGKTREEIDIKWISNEVNYSSKFEVKQLLSMLSVIDEERIVLEFSEKIGIRINSGDLSLVLAHLLD